MHTVYSTVRWPPTLVIACLTGKKYATVVWNLTSIRSGELQEGPKTYFPRNAKQCNWFNLWSPKECILCYVWGFVRIVSQNSVQFSVADFNFHSPFHSISFTESDRERCSGFPKVAYVYVCVWMFMYNMSGRIFVLYASMPISGAWFHDMDILWPSGKILETANNNSTGKDVASICSMLVHVANLLVV